MIGQHLPVEVKGHLKITDDLGQTHVDKDNAIHPRNMARIISRALANENNSHVNRIAFGNGGTVVDAAYQITYNTPNDGQSPDPAGWESRLYNETYSEIINESSVDLGSGDGAIPSGDPTSVEHVSGPGVRSNELGLTSEVVIEVVLNPGEPTGQFLTDNQTPTENTESDFTFDEIGLFTDGLPETEEPGQQYVNVNSKTSTDITGLTANTDYTYTITVNGGAAQNITITTPASGSGPSGEILFGDIVPLMNTNMVGVTASITDGINQTYGKIRFTSNTSGAGSSVTISDPGAGNYPADFLFSNIVGFASIEGPIAGQNAGVQNDPTNSDRERERMLTHIIFSPVLKSANRTLTITYTLTVAVARSV